MGFSWFSIPHGEIKSGTATDPSLRPPATLNDPLDERNPNAGAGIFPARVLALEDDENAVAILRLDADAVVPDGEAPAGPATGFLAPFEITPIPMSPLPRAKTRA